jgi:hypothetical protein
MAAGNHAQAAPLLEQVATSTPKFGTWLKLASVRRALGDVGAASDAAARALKLAPDNFMALLMFGTLQDAMGAEHRAGRVYRAALRNAPCTDLLPPPIRAQLDHARRRVAADDAWIEKVAAWRPGPELNHDAVHRLNGLRQSIIENSTASFEHRAEFLLPGLKSLEWFDPADFAGVGEIERQTTAVRDEFLRLTEAKAPQLAPYIAGLSTAQRDPKLVGKWSMIPLVRGGTVVNEYASHCPITMRLFDGIGAPGLGMISPSLYFSVLEPHSRIDPHIGITNARLIVHWPLIVPDSCGFRVGSETRHWEPGRALVFDDMIEHEVWNNSDHIRVVLISDLWRPELGQAERTAITQIMDRQRAIG